MCLITLSIFDKQISKLFELRNLKKKDGFPETGRIWTGTSPRGATSIHPALISRNLPQFRFSFLLTKTTLEIVFYFPVYEQAWYRLDGRWRPRPWLTTSWTTPSCSPSTSMMEPSWPIFLGMTSLSGIGFKRELSCRNFTRKFSRIITTLSGKVVPKECLVRIRDTIYYMVIIANLRFPRTITWKLRVQIFFLTSLYKNIN